MQCCAFNFFHDIPKTLSTTNEFLGLCYTVAEQEYELTLMPRVLSE